MRYPPDKDVMVAVPPVAAVDSDVPGFGPSIERVAWREVLDAVDAALYEHRRENFDLPEYVVLSTAHALALKYWGMDRIRGVRFLDERDLADARSEPEPVDVAEYLTERLREDAA